MNAAPPPLRFLALVLGLWVCMRVAMLGPGWQVEPDAAAALRPYAFSRSPAPALPPIFTAEAGMRAAPPAPRPRLLSSGRRTALPPSPTAVAAIQFALSPERAVSRPPPVEPAFAAAPGRGPAAAGGRWSGSAWLLVRRERGETALAAGGTLGGSQAGARIRYRVGRDLALSARAYVPLRRIGAVEAGFGLDWRPSSAIPIHLLAERRQGLGGEGRSAFALILYGGGGRTLPGGLRADAYAQAGIVGARRRDLFVDGSLRVSFPVGPVEAGVGAWGAAQPGAARLDAGPQVSFRLPVAGTNVRLQADWRMRVAGDAIPGSGPALTLAADF